MTALLSVSGVEKSFGGVKAARNISTQVDPGEIIAVVGPNGAGKTSFINLITGWIRPDAGEIVFNGRSIVGMTPRRIALSGLTRSFQISQIFPSLTVAGNLKLAIESQHGGGARLLRSFARAELENEAIELARRFDLMSVFERPAGELSQGTKKLLDIAMAGASQPRLLLLDEPTSGVSADEKHDLMKLIVSSSTATGAALLFVEHDMDIVREFAQRIIAFVGGEIACDDVPEVAFRHSFFEEQKKFMALKGAGSVAC